jgi:hypothetical protein
MRRIIDIQSHFLPEKWLNELSGRAQYPYLEKKTDSWLLHGSSHERLPYRPGSSGMDIQSKLEEMDEAGIELSLLSLSLPGPDNADADGEAEKLVGSRIRRRIIKAQSLYTAGALLCFVSTWLSIVVLILIQLNYAVVLFGGNRHTHRMKNEFNTE